MTTKADEETLEMLVDTHSLDWVIRTVADICYAKISHIETNWQDDSTAGEWRKAANRIDKLPKFGL